LLSAQILVLTLIPLLSGVVPGNGSPAVDLPALLGIEKSLSRRFMIGTWKYSDHYVRWGITDKKKARIGNSRGKGFMSLREDGTLKMVNLFTPDEGRWEVSKNGIAIYDPRHPERGTQILPIRKRDENRIWVLLPFAGGAGGIGMERASNKEMWLATRKAEQKSRKRTPLTGRTRARSAPTQ